MELAEPRQCRGVTGDESRQQETVREEPYSQDTGFESHQDESLGSGMGLKVCVEKE